MAFFGGRGWYRLPQMEVSLVTRNTFRQLLEHLLLVITGPMLVLCMHCNHKKSRRPAGYQVRDRVTTHVDSVARGLTLKKGPPGCGGQTPIHIGAVPPCCSSAWSNPSWVGLLYRKHARALHAREEARFPATISKILGFVTSV